MTNGIATATVETLTAEVRVLMVGSRQVTLSLARQLDRVDFEDMEPMGRIRITKGLVHIIGRRRTDGVLVTADFPKLLSDERLFLQAQDFDADLGRLAVCRHDKRVVIAYNREHNAIFFKDVFFPARLVKLCSRDTNHVYGDDHLYIACRKADVSNEFMLRYNEKWREHQAALQQIRYDNFLASFLPLLVLAGLK